MTNFQSFLVVYTLLAWLLWPAYQGGMGVLYALLFPFHALLFTQIKAIAEWINGR
jgi:hypothetical protein